MFKVKKEDVINIFLKVREQLSATEKKAFDISLLTPIPAQKQPKKTQKLETHVVNPESDYVTEKHGRATIGIRKSKT